MKNQLRTKTSKFKVRTVALLLTASLVIPSAVIIADQQATKYPDAQIHQPTPVPDRVFLGWEGDTATTQSVSWRTDDSVTSPVAQIALAESGPDFKSKARTVEADVSEDVEVNHDYTNKIHSVTFDNLEPNTKYLYRVGDGANWSEWFEFTTASDKDEPFSFIYVGDAQNNIHEHWSRVMRTAYSELSDASFILHAGDMIDQGDADEQWGGWFDGAGWIFGMVPSIATIGNHEYSRITQTPSQLAENWETQFHYPDNGPEGLEGQVGYWDYQGLRIISLNSNTRYADVNVQAEWLDGVLTDNPNRWTVVTFHHPIFSSGSGRNNGTLRDAILPVVEKHNVDLVLQGHDHTYARGHLSNEHDGESEYTTGTMFVNSVSGPKMYNWSDTNWIENGAYVRSGAERTQMYQHIHVDGDTLKYESYDALGELYDGFTMTKLSDNQKLVTETFGSGEPSEPEDPIESSIEQLKAQVEQLLAEEGIKNEETARQLQTHLTSVEHYEKAESMDKAINHLNQFKELLGAMKANELITESAYEELHTSAEKILEQWL